MQAPTVQQIVDHCRLKLKPELALLHWERDWRSYCVSPLYTEVITDEGELVSLKEKQGRGAALYARVSSAAQVGTEERDDGYSIEHQIRSGVLAAIKQGCQFRVYNDAGFSGFLPTNDPAIVAEMRKLQADLYKSVYEEVVLKDAHTWNTPEQIADMRRFLEHRYAAIIHGDKDAVQDAPGEAKQTDWNSSAVERVLYLRYQNHQSRKGYRPALHALMEDLGGIHSIFVTDPDRLSRNQVLFFALGKEFRKNEVEVYASSGQADWLTGSDLKAQLLNVIITWEAQRQLTRVKLGAMRGLVTMLRQGKPHSKLPFWLERDRAGYAQFAEDRLPVISRLIELAQEDEHIGIARLAQALVDLGVPSPQGKLWHGDTVGYALRNPLLYGCQVILGREWPMRDRNGNSLALISKEEWLRMHNRRQARYQNARGRPTPNRALMSGLLYCQCGYVMMYRQAHAKGPDRYHCHAPSTEKRKRTAEGLHHSTLRPNEVNAFFSELISEKAELLLQTRRDTSTVDLNVQEAKIREEYEEMERRVRQREALALKERGFDETSPRFQYALEANVSLVIEEQRAGFEQALARIERQRATRAALGRQEGDEERIRRFAELPRAEQNRILKTLIKRVNVKGPPEEEYLEILTHDEDSEPLPYVYLDTRVYRNGSLHRRVPTLAEWIASWSAIQPEEAVSP